MSQDQGNDMKPSDSDTNTELPLSRPGGGSQDSIDELDAILSQAFTDGASDTMWQNDRHVEIFATAKERLLAWHNTQLNRARVDELQRLAQEVGPAKDKETWEDWAWRTHKAIVDRINKLSAKEEENNAMLRL